MKSSFLVLQGIVGVKFMFGETIPFVRRKCVTSLIDGSSVDVSATDSKKKLCGMSSKIKLFYI
jgi:chemotaxis receptor (MCP) glutamine deamidase CheD